MMYSFEHVSALKSEAFALSTAERGRFLANLVVTSPGQEDTAAWAKRNVRLGTDPWHDIYRDIVLAAAAVAARNTRVADDFVAALDEHDEPLAERISEDLSARIAIDVLNRLELDGTARARVASWALGRITDPAKRVDAVMYVLDVNNGTDLVNLLPVVGQLSDTNVVNDVAEKTRPRLEALQRQAQEEAALFAAQEGQRQARRQYEDSVRRDPAAAFDQLATELGLSAENIDEFDFGEHEWLVRSADMVLGRVLHGTQDALPPLMETVLRHVVAQQRTPQRAPRWFSEAANSFKRVPLLTAGNAPEFWQRAAEFDSDEDIKGLYRQWRARHISTALRHRNEQVLATNRDWPGAQFPDNVAVWVSARSATISYKSVDDLVAHMWQYFVPASGRPPSIDQASPAKASNNSGMSAGFGISGVDDIQNMRRVEEEIRAWADDTSQQPYIDDEVSGDEAADAEYRITVERNKNGIALRFKAEGYGLSDADLIEHFSAFTGEPLQYDGAIGVKYQLLPPPNVTDLPLHQAPRWTDTSLGAYELPLPVDQVTNHLRQLGGPDVDRRQIIDAFTAHTPISGTEDKPTTLATVNALADITRMRAPSFDVSVHLDDPALHSQMVEALLVAARVQQRPEHPHGFLGGYGFEFNEESARVIKDRAEEQKPAVVSRELGTRSDELTLIEVRPTNAEPQWGVVFYVGDDDPHSHVDEAKAAITAARAAAGGATDVPMPNIVLLGHAGTTADSKQLSGALFLALKRTKCMPGEEDNYVAPDQSALVVRNPDDRDALIEALQSKRASALYRVSLVTHAPESWLAAQDKEQLDAVLLEHAPTYGNKWYASWRNAVHRPAQLAEQIQHATHIGQAVSDRVIRTAVDSERDAPITTAHISRPHTAPGITAQDAIADRGSTNSARRPGGPA
ncbi:MAG: hypothetical protein HOQ05_07675 [Corynebacteriales bacterium]|nr:hypothetical protein [Mycobacteriales bacterium]